MADRTALVVTTHAADGSQENGATLRAAEVVQLLTETGHRVVRTTVTGMPRVAGRFDVGVAVSYACAGALRALRHRSDRVWLDAVDSWILVNGSALRRGRASYALRAVRDGSRLAQMAEPDLLTYISRADLDSDHGTVRGRLRLVLPGRTPPVVGAPGSAGRRAVLAGDWTYPPNRDGLRWFTCAVMPLLEGHAGAWHVALYGPGLAETSSSRIRNLGYVADPTMLYRDDDVHVAPVRFGGGVKRKVLMPLLSGLPVVTTSAGAHGLRAHRLLDVRDGHASFAAALAQRLGSAQPRPAPVPPGDVLDQDDSMHVIDWLQR